MQNGGYCAFFKIESAEFLVTFGQKNLPSLSCINIVCNTSAEYIKKRNKNLNKILYICN